MVSHKRRIAHDVTDLPGRHDGFPVNLQRIAADNRAADLQGDADKVKAELFRHQQIHLVIHQPQSHLRDLRGKLLNLDAEKLIDIQVY